jgi:hypothetical protein
MVRNVTLLFKLYLFGINIQLYMESIVSIFTFIFIMLILKSYINIWVRISLLLHINSTWLVQIFSSYLPVLLVHDKIVTPLLSAASTPVFLYCIKYVLGRLRMFENRAMRIFWPNREKMTTCLNRLWNQKIRSGKGPKLDYRSQWNKKNREKIRGGGGRRNLYDGELHNLYSSPNIIRVIKSRNMRRTGM